ncbi:MAG: hypothetical protein DRP78_00800 [Candidatus Omnitrophota bacterium]|nr:MAG: hypothetical protein DRP78_00800 [Candidatus Omnitrophota bacterium]
MFKNKGFSLIEMIMVVIIVGLLASIAVPNYRKMLERSKYAQAKNNLQSMRNALTDYYTENDVFTDNITDLETQINADFSDNNDWHYGVAAVATFATLTYTITATRQRGYIAAAGHTILNIDQNGVFSGAYYANAP